MSGKVMLWDFDGTLGYRNGMWSSTLFDIVQRHRPEIACVMEDFRPHMRQGFPWHQHEVAHTHLVTAEAWWSELEPFFANAFQAVGVEADRTAELAKHVRAEYAELSKWQLYEDVLPTLQELTAKGWQHAIVSNHVPELEQIVEGLGLAPHMTKIINSAWVGYEKPHPQIYRYALEQMNHPETVWMVGDSLTADVQGAEAYGINAILVRKSDTSSARHCLHLQDVIAIVEG
ncbi:MAG: HAD family hydrolase [Tumebacillaceae bacterium]